MTAVRLNLCKRTREEEKQLIHRFVEMWDKERERERETNGFKPACTLMPTVALLGERWLTE